MKRALAATIAVVAVLFAANMLGVAVAEAPTGTPLRTISVQGTATLAIGQNDDAAAATAVYREGMAAAVTDGQSKASFLASKLGATLGAVQSAAEGGGYIDCTGGPESYAEYEGEQPDFGAATQPTVVAPAAAAAPTSAAGRLTHGATPKRAKRKHAKAKKSAAVTCKLTAQVSLIYTIS